MCAIWWVRRGGLSRRGNKRSFAVAALYASQLLSRARQQAVFSDVCPGLAGQQAELIEYVCNEDEDSSAHMVGK
jgi:hypothetical protein